MPVGGGSSKGADNPFAVARTHWFMRIARSPGGVILTHPLPVGRVQYGPARRVVGGSHPRMGVRVVDYQSELAPILITLLMASVWHLVTLGVEGHPHLRFFPHQGGRGFLSAMESKSAGLVQVVEFRAVARDNHLPLILGNALRESCSAPSATRGTWILRGDNRRPTPAYPLPMMSRSRMPRPIILEAVIDVTAHESRWGPCRP